MRAKRTAVGMICTLAAAGFIAKATPMGAVPIPALTFTGNPDAQGAGGSTNITRGWAF